MKIILATLCTVALLGAAPAMAAPAPSHDMTARHHVDHKHKHKHKECHWRHHHKVCKWVY